MKKKKQKKRFSDEYRKYIKSAKWRALKQEVIALRSGACEKCGSKKYLQVHHLNYKNLFNEQPRDLMVLCLICHSEEHSHLTLSKRIKLPLWKKVDVIKQEENYKKALSVAEKAKKLKQTHWSEEKIANFLIKQQKEMKKTGIKIYGKDSYSRKFF